MTGKTSIEWTAMPGYEPAVWNPTTGCTRVSAGCDNCYAFALHDKRYATNLKAAKAWGREQVPAIPEMRGGGIPTPLIRRAREEGEKLPWPKQYDLPFSRVQLLEDRVDAPLRKGKPTCYFVDSMADLFHEDVPDEFITRVFDVMDTEASPEHRYLILTKRPERMCEFVTKWNEDRFESDRAGAHRIWLGTSVEDQRAADERIPHLLATPAAVRFLSCEPLLGPVDLSRWLWEQNPVNRVNMWGEVVDVPLRELQWVIVGGESGPRARPMDLAWPRALRDQCAAAGVSVFVKQLGSKPTVRVRTDHGDEGGEWWGDEPLKLRESHGRDVDEWPADLRIRTWPR